MSKATEATAAGKTGYRLAALGMINALGQSGDEIYERLLDADTSVLTKRDDLIPNREVLVGQVRAPLPEIPEELSDYASRNSQLTAAAYQQIAAEVQLAAQTHGAHRIGIVLGSSTSGIAESERAIEHLVETGSMPSDYRYSRQEIGSVAEFLSKYAGLTGPSYTVSTACTSSTKAFLSARSLLENDLCDAVVVGGADSLCKYTLNGFNSLGLLCEGISNPFSVHRSGIVIGEAASLFLLTREAGGIQLLGVGHSADAYHMSTPDPEGKGADSSMRMALQDADLAPKDICYINLHGTGTPANDSAEASAVRKIFSEDTPCSSTKPLTGHTLGASGATEIGFCWLCLERQLQEGIPIPPHSWDAQVDEQFPSLRLATKGLHLRADAPMAFLSNSFAFGGSNCTVIIGREG